MDFKIDRVPAHSSWIHQFSLQAMQTRNSSNDVMYFVYPRDKTQQCSKSVTRQGLLTDFNCFPQDFFFASKINQSDYRKVFLVNRGQKLSYGISLDDHPNCCSQTIEDYFFANLSLPSKYCEMCVSNDPIRDLLVTRYTKKFSHDLFSCSSNSKVLSPFLLYFYFGPLQQKFSIGCYLSNYILIKYLYFY